MKNTLLLLSILMLASSAAFNYGCKSCHGNNKNAAFDTTNVIGDPSGPTTTINSTYGASSANGCAGRGVCTGVSGGQGIGILFNIGVNTLKDTLTVWFALKDTANMPQSGTPQGQFFRTANGSYIFDMPLDVTTANALISGGKCTQNCPWNITGSSIIQAGVAYPYTVQKDSVVMTIPVSHPKAVTLNVIFGARTAAGNFNGGLPGVFSITSAPTQPQGDSIPASIPVTFALQSGNAGVLQAFFDTTLLANQPLQRPLFPPKGGTTTQYNMGNFPLTNSMFAPVMLPPNASLISNPATVTTGGGWDTIRNLYGFVCVPVTLNGNTVTTSATTFTVNLTTGGGPLYVIKYAPAGQPRSCQQSLVTDSVWTPATSFTAPGLCSGIPYNLTVINVTPGGTQCTSTATITPGVMNDKNKK